MKKILYIEDDKDTAQAVKIILDNSGFQTEIACSGKECLEKIKKDFDLFLSDIMLPDMSGWDIFESLKNRGVNSKFAFLSAIPISQERMQELKKSGVSDYITKPFAKQDLVNKIKKILINKILYVEDDLDTAEAVKTVLKSQGFEIEIACSGKECLEKIKEYFDLILLDMMLPDMSGWDIFERLNGKSKIKFAFLTCVDADSKRIEELKQAGILDYIKKPFAKEDLILRVNRILTPN